MDPQLAQLLQQHADNFSEEENGKILCKLNGHAFPARYDVLKSFIDGNKYKNLATRAAADQSLSKYEPFVVQSRNFPLMLYCALTGQLIDKNLEAVKLHMKGKRFQGAQARFQEDEVELRPEPTLESLGVRLPPDHPLSAAAAAAKAAAEAAEAAGEGDDAGDGEEPAFWQPEDGELSDEEEEGEGEEAEEEEASGSGGSSMEEIEGEGLVLQEKHQNGHRAHTGEDDPMEVEEEPAPSSRRGAAASSNGTAGGGKGKQQAGAGGGKRSRAAAAGVNGVGSKGAAVAAGGGKKGRSGTAGSNGAAAAAAGTGKAKPGSKGQKPGHGSTRPGRPSAQKKVKQ